jgi:hypothetical protein
MFIVKCKYIYIILNRLCVTYILPVLREIIILRSFLVRNIIYWDSTTQPKNLNL